MAYTLDFPASPNVGQIFTSANKYWQWTGSAWRVIQGANPDTFAAVDGGNFADTATGNGNAVDGGSF